MKEDNIKIKIGCLITVIILGMVGWWAFQKEKAVKVIGESKWAFDLVLKNWNENQAIKKFHYSIKLKKEPYLLVECGATNGTSLYYYLVDFKRNRIWANFWGIKGIFSLQPSTSETIKYVLKPIKRENQIYDGTSKMLDDGVYFITFHNKKQTIQYGFYSLSGYFGRYENRADEGIALENRVIFYKVINLIENEIYHQKPELLKKRPLFNCLVGWLNGASIYMRIT